MGIGSCIVLVLVFVLMLILVLVIVADLVLERMEER